MQRLTIFVWNFLTSGAEKALFRALKTKKDTPKYGLIYHASMIGQASVKNKGKMSRSLAAKAALAVRVDAFGEDNTGASLGAEHRAKLEARLQLLEEGNLRKLSGTGRVKSQFEKYHVKTEVSQYPTEADSTLPSSSSSSGAGKKRKLIEEVESKPLIEEIKPEEPETPTGEKKKKKKKKAAEEEAAAAAPVEPVEEATPAKKAKKSKKVKTEAE